MLLLPIRTLLIPRMSFTNEELAILDGPTASDFVSNLVFTPHLPSCVLLLTILISVLFLSEDYEIRWRWHFLKI